MNLNKAIELSKEAVISLGKGKFHDHADAVKLGIEALQLVKLNRELWGETEAFSLPGETPEADSP